MAFWGIEVKPGMPFTHQYDHSKGRLHISMGTLGFGTAQARSTLQCNVGNKSPVYVCSLYPGHTESLQLNLEFQELVENVTFSVVGPRSIHLCGHYLAPVPNTNIADDSESYGIDIANTQSERSENSDEDDTYDDSFIDDDNDPEVFSPSPISNKEGASFNSRSKGKKGNLRLLRKKYQTVGRNDSVKRLRKKDKSKDGQSKDIDNEDSLPISSLYKNKASGRALDQEMDDSDDEGEWDSRCLFPTKTIQMHRETETMDKILPSAEVCQGQGEKPKKRKDCSKETETMDKILPSAEVCQGQGEKPKKKRKDRPKTVDDGARDFPDGNLSEDREVKKRKKKSKSQGKVEVVNSVD
ncbi:peptidyl-prolyl cis-trans isomerase FKBP43-like isoform X2 [Lotus japonicus]|uniref:peptidyl-prolyl cis-trans isomerase FKBP43-like isoform X2 n=2 Tax=Lotus japonicus TaxID=34305 RepID=UPI002588B1B3|nr:peptidyl-prolyl cis-trans isomerase FKBP43-like isoform X2 [Lotus japonicus]